MAKKIAKTKTIQEIMLHSGPKASCIMSQNGQTQFKVLQHLLHDFHSVSDHYIGHYELKG